MKKLFFATLIGFLFFTPACETEPLDCPAPGAGQQLNAHVHLNWNWSGNNFYNIDQKIRITQLAPATFWTNQFQFTGGGTGYMGLQKGGINNPVEQVRFSIWDAVDCIEGTGADCNTFTGEGDGLTITLPLDIIENHDYRLRVWNVGHEGIYTWWAAFVRNLSTNEGYYIGSIKVANSPSISHAGCWTEYWGGSFADIDCVPRTNAYFYPPTANNNDETNSFQYEAIFNNFNVGNGTNGNVSNVTLNGNPSVKHVVQGGY